MFEPLEPNKEIATVQIGRRTYLAEPYIKEQDRFICELVDIMIKCKHILTKIDDNDGYLVNPEDIAFVKYCIAQIDEKVKNIPK